MTLVRSSSLMWLSLLYGLIILAGSSFGRYQAYLSVIADHVEPVLATAWQDSADYQFAPALEQLLGQRLARELDGVQGNLLLSQLQQCHSSLYQFGRQGEPGSAGHSRWLPWSMSWWHDSAEAPQPWLQIDCRIQPLPWLSLTLLLASVTALGWHWIGKPVRDEDQHLITLLFKQETAWLHQNRVPKRSKIKAGVLHFRALYPAQNINGSLLETLIKTNRATFSSEQQYVMSLLTRASQPPELHFDVTGGKVQVCFAGIPIALSVTPALYLFWYALKRKEQDTEGWVRNPPSNKPDRELAHSLLALMHQYAGHGRAIRELEQVGLKAKSLDQNRSKIKEAFSAVLGEEASESALFASRKGDDNPQAEYRLKISPEKITIAS
ncbi:hypothetical protein [Photobacterium sp. TLY01]|uniref:hypothetical protein n=1 Tax=Photobacterium sp. TLY01 TaxID=2907534 RepID=UPI001F3EAA95|nr:hypothetical protein [Photobacterium sp. TLY01]UIP27400.1 hypothetical protein LN341_12335 [Photobacterium sp. TLY01]